MAREKHVFSGAYGVCHAWAAGSVTWARSSNVFYDDLSTIFSYGRHFPLACAISRVPGKEVALLNSRSYSITTSKHQGDIRSAISHWPVKVYCPDPRGGLRGDHRENLAYFHDQAKAAWGKIAGARTRERERERWAAQAAENALALEEKIRLWRGHELKWGLPYGAGTLLRLSTDGKRIQTSHGAEVLRVHAPVLWATVQRVRAGGVEWVPENTITIDYFRLSKVGADGTLFIGCHMIPYAEIERMAGELGLK